MMEVDQVAFRLGLSERIRVRVENVGRVKLSDEEAVALVKTKTVHVTAIVVAVNLALFVARLSAGGAAAIGIFVLPNLGFFVASCAEAFEPGSSASEIAQTICKSIGSAIVGQMAVMLVMIGA